MSPPFKALVVTERKQKTPLTLVDFAKPELAEGEVLIQNVAVAQNPVDWKGLDWDIKFLVPEIPWVLGADTAGTVYALGPGVKGFNVGDRVISFLEQSTPRRNAFQTYSIADAPRVVKLPEHYSFEEGSTMPVAFVTAGASLAHALEVQLPAPSVELPLASKGEPFLVWGGAASVGAYTIQIAKAIGYTVLATASPKNFEYVKSLAASEVFDYRDPDVVKKIRAAAGPNLALALDSVSEGGTIEMTAASLTAPSGKVATIQPAKPEQSTESVQVIGTGSGRARDPVIGPRVYGLLGSMLEKHLLVPNPVKVVPGGLHGVNEGLQLGREHKVSGEKLVYRVSETKF